MTNEDTPRSRVALGRIAVVVGAGGGIGHALVTALAGDDTIDQIIALARTPQRFSGEKIISRMGDVTDEASLATALGDVERIDLCIVATGLLHARALQPEKSWRAIDAAALSRLYAVNAIGPLLVAKHVIPRMSRQDRAVFAALSARVGSISDNRLGGWYGYRASKAALNQLLRTLAIELARTHPAAIAVGLHPGTVATGLSQPFRANVPDGNLFNAVEAAARLIDVLARLTPADSGNQIAFDGSTVPP